MVRFGNFDAGDSLGVFAVLGVGFSVAAWLLTIGVKPLPYEVRQPRKESAALLLYLIPLAAFVALGFSAIHRLVPTEPSDSIAMLVAKLTVFVAIPAWIMMTRFGYKLVDLAPSSLKTSHLLVVLGMSLVLLIFQSVAGRGLRDIADAHVPGDKLILGLPLVFLWLMLEVGVVEEFFFRVLLAIAFVGSRALRVGWHRPYVSNFRTGARARALPAHQRYARRIGSTSLRVDGSGLFDRNHLSRRLLSRSSVGANPQLPRHRTRSCRHRPAAQYTPHSSCFPHIEIAPL